MRRPHHIASMRFPAILLALLLALATALAPMTADARAGGGFSFGSRGARTYMAPPATRTAPGYAAPLRPPAYGMAGYGGGSSFMRGVMGGLVGAGIAGLLLGHGFFWGMHGIGGVFGLLIQVLLIVLLVRWLMRVFAGGGALAGGGPAGGVAAPGMTYAPPPAATAPLMPQPEDYRQFEAALHRVQAAWSAGDLAALQRLATPEMAATFAQQLRELQARGLRNEVSDVRLLQGDLSEAWHENGADYATVAMRFSMIDVTRDAACRVVDGAAGEHVEARELWTFLRPPGGAWTLSAIQQTG